MPCEGVENLIRNPAIAFTVILISGLLVLYCGIRKLACSTSYPCSPNQVYGLNVIAAAFSVAVLLFSLMRYIPSRNGRSVMANGAFLESYWGYVSWT